MDLPWFASLQGRCDSQKAQYASVLAAPSTRLGSCLHRSGSCHGAVAGSLFAAEIHELHETFHLFQPAFPIFPTWLVRFLGWSSPNLSQAAHFSMQFSAPGEQCYGVEASNNCEHVIEFQRYHAISKASKILRHEANFCSTYSQPTGSTFMVPAAPHTDVQPAICSEPLNLTR